MFGYDENVLINVVGELIFDLGFLENGEDGRCYCLVEDNTFRNYLG